MNWTDFRNFFIDTHNGGLVDLWSDGLNCSCIGAAAIQFVKQEIFSEVGFDTKSKQIIHMIAIHVCNFRMHNAPKKYSMHKVFDSIPEIKVNKFGDGLDATWIGMPTLELHLPSNFQILNWKKNPIVCYANAYDVRARRRDMRTEVQRNNNDNNTKMATLSLLKPISSYSSHAKLFIAIGFPKTKTKLFSANGFPRLLKFSNISKYHWEMRIRYFPPLFNPMMPTSLPIQAEAVLNGKTSLDRERPEFLWIGFCKNCCWYGKFIIIISNFETCVCSPYDQKRMLFFSKFRFNWRFHIRVLIARAAKIMLCTTLILTLQRIKT